MENMFGLLREKMLAGSLRLQHFTTFSSCQQFVKCWNLEKPFVQIKSEPRVLDVFMVQLGHSVTGQQIPRAGLKFQHALGGHPIYFE